jgi:hypothetical protein
VGTTYQSLPKVKRGESLDARLAKLIVWSNSLDGYLYSVGSALTELRKEIADIKQQIRRKRAHRNTE